mmetsp:Transcript_95324/g.169249  ORF Transcript_95324/g.169249 Transcript_95324/m.169249 type:complete len:949 (+) Transcript_95324:3-2849(+)
MIPFLPGLGPRKARLFEKCLAEPVSSRQQLTDLIAKHLGIEDPDRSPVVTNCLPFIKIKKDPRGSKIDEDSISGLDRTRLASQHLQPWVESFCKKILEAHRVEGDDSEIGDDPTGRVLRKLNAEPGLWDWIQDADWGDWEELTDIETPPCADLEKLFEVVAPEIQTPYKDGRQDFLDLDYNEMYYMASSELDDATKVGTLVRGTVQRDTEHPDFVNLLMAEGKDEKATKNPIVRVTAVPSGLNGIFDKYTSRQAGNAPIKSLIDATTGKPKILEKGTTVYARFKQVQALPIQGPRVFQMRLSVDAEEDLWYKEFPIKGEDIPYFVPEANEDFQKVQLGEAQSTKEQAALKTKEWIRRPRNIHHPNWFEGDFEEALKALHQFKLGNVLFRGSKHFDIIQAMLKVFRTNPEEQDGSGLMSDPRFCFRQFDVYEIFERKTVSQGFEIASELEVDGIRYRDFDEIIARHMEPISDNLRTLQEHKRCGLREGTIMDLETVQDALKKFSQGNGLLHYNLLLDDKHVGHGLLLWCMKGKKVRKEFIEISPEGFSLWGRPAEDLSEMLHWFKTAGLRNATRCRKDFKNSWQVKKKQAQERRKEAGVVIENEELKTMNGMKPTTRNSGLQTPRGGLNSAAMTPTAGVYESNAPTPAGMNPMSAGVYLGRFPPPSRDARNPGSANPMTANPATPQGAPGTPMPNTMASATPRQPAGMLAPTTPFRGGSSTPVGGVGAPMTPAQSSGRVPQTPRQLLPSGNPASRTPGSVMPVTPAAALLPPATPRPTPGAPGAARIPQTPRNAMPVTPGTRIPSTPRQPATPGAAVPQTPGAAVPNTPGSAPFTPAGPGPRTPGGAVPSSPGPGPRPGPGPGPTTPGSAVPLTPGLGPGPRTPGAAVPMTPGPDPGPRTPGGVVPMTPGPGPHTPGPGPGPRTPGPGPGPRTPGAPQTPAAAPQTPRG